MPSGAALGAEDDSEIRKTRVADGPRAGTPEPAEPAHVQRQPGGAGLPTPARLVISAGADRGREFVLSAPEVTIGRGTDNDIVLSDIAVSRRHVILHFDGRRFSVRDLGSGNGTLVNGVPIAGEGVVRDGDQIEIGNTLARFVQPIAAEPEARLAGPDLSDALPLMAAPSAIVTGGAMAMAAGQAQPGAPAWLDPAAGVAPPASGIPGGPFDPRLSYPDPAGAPARGLSRSSYDLRPSLKRPLIVAGIVGGAVVLVIAAVMLLSSGHDRRKVATPGTAASAAETAAPGDTTKAGAVPIVAGTSSPTVTGTGASTGAGTGAGSAIGLPSGGQAASGDKPATTPSAGGATPRDPAADRPTPSDRPVHGAGGKTASSDPSSRTRRQQSKSEGTDKATSSGAERTAATQYKDKQFSRAAATLRAAAAQAASDREDRLNATAADYTAVGTALERGASSANSNPAVALAAYQDALRLDARSGKGAHAGYIRGLVAKTAPRAAAAHLTAGRLEAAKSACDVAASAGSGTDPQVTRIRGQLERKAGEFYAQGKQVEARMPTDAKALYRRVLKLVPLSSPWYGKAYAALNQLAKRQSVDEDE